MARPPVRVNVHPHKGLGLTTDIQLRWPVLAGMVFDVPPLYRPAEPRASCTNFDGHRSAVIGARQLMGGSASILCSMIGAFIIGVCCATG